SQIAFHLALPNSTSKPPYPWLTDAREQASPGLASRRRDEDYA
uniref:Transposase n=1 Tax=Mesocestoides corti TaxID=53468 RepID=A0A5K3G8G1_MESCO